MKVRSGFVSNSSTSSFVVCGYKVTDEIMEKLRKLANLKEGAEQYDILDQVKLPEGISTLWTDDFNLIGYVIADVSDGDSCESQTSLREIEAKVAKLQSLIEVEERPTIFTGTRSC